MKIDFSIEISDDQIELIKKLGKFEETNVDWFQCPLEIIYSFYSGTECNRSYKINERLKILIKGPNKSEVINIATYDYDHGQQNMWLSFIGGLIYNQIK
jgi:hypothetical protein